MGNPKLLFKEKEVIGIGNFKLSTDDKKVFELDGFIYHEGDIVRFESPQYSGLAEFIGHEYGIPKFVALKD